MEGQTEGGRLEGIKRKGLFFLAYQACNHEARTNRNFSSLLLQVPLLDRTNDLTGYSAPEKNQFGKSQKSFSSKGTCQLIAAVGDSKIFFKLGISLSSNT